MNNIKQIYLELYNNYGPQGWWPLLDHNGTNPTKTGSITGYHISNYNLPNTPDEVFEICIGAVLTQNTGWANVEKALFNLKKLNAINPQQLLKLNDKILIEAIRPAGYFNQKTRKLKEFTRFFISLNNKTPKREELLNIWGIGPETADSMLLYAFKIPTFVVDAYTKRIFTNLELIDTNAEYNKIKALFEDNLKPDLILYQEYHALLVEHAKRYYSKKTEYNLCPLYNKFSKN